MFVRVIGKEEWCINNVETEKKVWGVFFLLFVDEINKVRSILSTPVCKFCGAIRLIS